MPSPSSNLETDKSAGLLKRVAALVYDLMLILASWMVLGGILVALNGNEIITLPILPLLLPLVTVLFYLYFWLKSGQTLGMQTWRIKLVSTESQSLTIKQCLIRMISATLSLCCLGLGYFWLWFDPDRLTWHDRLSGTRVIHVAKAARAIPPA